MTMRARRKLCVKSRSSPSYGGISYEKLENVCPQWPCPTPDHPGTPILHAEKFSRGKGQFMPLKYPALDGIVDADYPLLLTTGRSIYHFHTGTMTRKVRGLNKMCHEELVEINPQDAKALRIEDGEMVKVVSRRGEVTVKAKVNEVSPPGVVYMTFHFAEVLTNKLTNAALDQYQNPGVKVSAVRVEKIKEPVKV